MFPKRGNVYYPIWEIASQMGFQVRPDLGILLGSETRAKVLAFLADAREPKTGYEVAKATGLNPPKAYRELERLSATEFVKVVEEPRRKRFLLVNDDLRRLVLRYARITTGDEWFSPARVRERRGAFERAARIRLTLPESRPNPDAVPNRSEYERSPAKVRALRRVARMKLRGSKAEG